jgi:hypothetical protein
MKFWFDTEFIDNGKTIELVSIGIIDEKDRSYYAVSNEFDIKAADDWVKENVLPFLPSKDAWKNKSLIRQEIIEFIGKPRPQFWVYNGAYDWVAFCQLFGHIRNLPANYPWYANDIKQLWRMLDHPTLPKHNSLKHNALEDAKWNKLCWKFLHDLAETRGFNKLLSL